MPNRANEGGVNRCRRAAYLALALARPTTMVVDVWHAGAAGAAHRVELDPLFPSLRARESGLAVSPLRFRHAVTAAPTLFKRLKKTATYAPAPA